MCEILLASKSTIRAQLLRAAGVPIEIIRADLDERAFEARWRRSGGSPLDVAKALAEAKALAADAPPDCFVIGADQTLHGPDDEPLSKVATLDQARERLWAQRSDWTRLRTGVALSRNGDVLASGLVETRIKLRAFSDQDLTAYLAAAGDEILGSVACYQIEGLGLRLIEAIDGDYFAALGLPMLWLLDALRRENAIDAGAPV